MMPTLARILVAAVLPLIALPWPEALAVVPGGPAEQVPVPSPSQVPPELAVAVQAMNRGDAAAALRSAMDYVKRNPGSAVGQEVLGTAALMAWDFKGAELALTEALRLEPRRVSTMLRLGQVGLQSGEPKKAEGWFRRAVATAPDPGVARRGLAVALLRQGRIREALDEAREAVQRSQGKDLDATLFLAGLYQELGLPAEAEDLLDGVVGPGSPPHALLLLGLAKLELRKVDEAGPLLQKAYDADPKSRWTRLGLAAARRARGELEPARQDFEKLTTDHPDWSLANFELGRTLLAERRVDDALRAFARAEQTTQSPAVARLRASQLLLAAGEVDQAIARAKVAQATPAVAPFARSVLVQAYLAQSRPDLARQELQAAVDGSPSDAFARMQLGRFLMSQGKGAEALAEFERAAALRPGAPEPLIGQAEARLLLKQPDEAVRAAVGAVKAQPSRAEYWVFLGTAQERAGRPLDAMRSYETALQREPNHLGGSRALAAAYERNKRPADALRVLEAASRAHPESLLLLFELAGVRERSGDLAAAEATYREVLRRSPDHSIAMNNLAYLLARNPKALDEALDLAERAHQHAPGNASVADTLGWVLYQRDSLERAESVLAQAAQAAPGSAMIRYHLGLTYARRGKPAEARAELEAALPGLTGAEAADAHRALEALQ
jgi:cellulose synthase operon protein C